MYKQVIIVVIFLHMSNANDPDTVQYGIQDPTIIGGVEASDGYSKYMVSLVMNDVVRFFFCGGTIITKRHVLSAAHCIIAYVIRPENLPPQLEGVIGSNYWNSTLNVIKFSKYINHPDYDRYDIENDIGILITNKDIIFNDRVEPIKLNFEWIYSDVGSFVTGWGLYKNDMVSIPDRLQLLVVETISPLACIIGVKKAIMATGSGPPLNPFTEICTYHSKGHGMCGGDSGSPLVLQGSREQIGIVSWGFPCAIGAPDVFVRLSAYKDFLQSVIGDL